MNLVWGTIRRALIRVLIHTLIRVLQEKCLSLFTTLDEVYRCHLEIIKPLGGTEWTDPVRLFMKKKLVSITSNSIHTPSATHIPWKDWNFRRAYAVDSQLINSRTQIIKKLLDEPPLRSETWIWRWIWHRLTNWLKLA